MGTALNWTYQDIVARYKRMRGFNVLFPQGIHENAPSIFMGLIGTATACPLRFKWRSDTA
jgi:hypothetical protein